MRIYISVSVLSELEKFYNEFIGKKGIIGKTGKGKPIPFFAIKKSEFPVVICQYAIHAREYVTTAVALMQIKEFIKSGKTGKVYFIPAVNIDGIEIALKEKPLYKANAFGVDLNVNFDARWGTGAKNVRVVADENYIGKKPFSERETRALRDFTVSIKPHATLSYHTKGEEIYYEFFQSPKDKERDYNLAKKISDCTGYAIKSTPYSAGGYKDWCIEKLKIPAFTIEAGRDDLTHPISLRYAAEIFEKNKRVINVLTESL